MKCLVVLALCVAATMACRDTTSNCRSLKNYCSSNPWVRSNCQQTCELCGPSTGCTDKHGSCRSWVTYCRSNSYVKDNCRKTCGLCPAPPVCTDKSNSCRSWVKLCLSNDYVKENCQKTCGICSTTPVTQPPVTQPPVTQPPRTQPPRTQPPSGSCGRPSYPQSRVVGGKTAKAHSWPWQIGLHQNGGFMCGGSIIDARWVVTAAHCVHRRNARDFTVKLGDHNRNSNEGEQLIQVEKIITHAGYGRLNNDIALLKLSKPAFFNDKIKPVCLPRQGDAPPVGSKCYITGWGKMRHPGSSVQYLQQLALTIQDKSSCHTKNSKYTTITDQMLCAANTDVSANQSGCHGDSGGPFVCQNNDGSWTLHGAVSWGSPECDIKDAYTVFARIGQFRTWIDLNVQRN